MANITVTFENDTMSETPVVVENIEDWFDKAADNVEPAEAIDEALEIVDSAPAFDYVDASEITPTMSTVQVVYEI